MSSMIGSTGFAGPVGSTTGAMMKNKIPKGYESGRMAQFTPEQMQLFQSMFSHVSPDSYLSKLAGGDQSMFEQIEAPAHRQFQGSIGQLASRFSGMGGVGARRSSGFQNTAGEAASQFAQELASKRHSLQSQAIRDLMGMSGELMQQRPYEQFLVKKNMPFWQQLLLGGTQGLAQGAGQAAAMAAMA